MSARDHTTPLDASLRVFAGYNLKRAYLLLREAVLEALTPYGLRPPSFSTLVIIGDNPDLSQSRLAEALNIKRSGMVLIVDELEHAGLITRNPVHGDRRSYALRATLKGMRVREQAMRAVTAVEADVLTAFSPDEHRLLGELFNKTAQPDEHPVSNQEKAL